MKSKIVVIFIMVMFIGSLRASEPILSGDIANNINNSTNKDEIIKNETEELYHEIESLRSKLQNTEQQNEQLKQSLTEYQNKEKLNISKDNNILLFKTIISSSPFINQEINDEDYKLGYQAIMFNNLGQAQTYLTKFINKDFSKAQNDLDDKEQEDYQKRVLMLKNKSYYMLGYIKLINLQPSEALSDLAIAYKNSFEPNLVLLSLMKLLEIFDMLEKQQEVCLTVKRIYTTIVQVQSADSNFVVNQDDINRVQEVSNKNSCDTNFDIATFKNNINENNALKSNSSGFYYPERKDTLINQENTGLQNKQVTEGNDKNNSNNTSPNPVLESNDNEKISDNKNSLTMPDINGKINNNFIDN